MNGWSRAAFLAGSAASAVAASEPARAQSRLPTLRVGVTATDLFAEAYFAADTGIFQRNGLDVDVQTFSSGSAASNAVLGGSLDIGITTPLLLANGHLRGIPFAIVAAGALNTPKAPQSLLCVSASGPVRTPKDLAGKTVGVNVLRTVLELSLDAYLVRHGVNVADVRTVEVVFSEEGPAIQRGTIAAAVMTEPALSAALKENGVRALGDPNVDIAPRFLASAWFTTRQFAQQNPEAIRRFAAAIYQTARWANGHHAQSAPILAKYAKLDPAIVRTMTRSEFAESTDLPEMQALLDSAVKFGFLPKPVSAADLLVTA